MKSFSNQTVKTKPMMSKHFDKPTNKNRVLWIVKGALMNIFLDPD